MVLMLLQELQIILESGSLLESIILLSPYTLKQKKKKHLNLVTIIQSKYTYISTIATHKTLGRIKMVFIKTKDNLIPIISTNTNLSDIEIINTYKNDGILNKDIKI